MKSDFKRILLLILAGSLYFVLSEGRKKLGKTVIITEPQEKVSTM